MKKQKPTLFAHSHTIIMLSKDVITDAEVVAGLYQAAEKHIELMKKHFDYQAQKPRAATKSRKRSER